ncbi:MAG: hypothetical protein AABO41_07765 [Acidobacteriota bacterium]
MTSTVAKSNLVIRILIDRPTRPPANVPVNAVKESMGRVDILSYAAISFYYLFT